MVVFVKDTPIEEIMVAKRVPVYHVALAEYFSLIKERITANSDTLQAIADTMTPAYPIIKMQESDDRYHISASRFILESSLRQMHKDMPSISHAEWQACIKEYMDIPAPSKSELSKASNFIHITDEMLEILNGLGKFMDTLGIKIRGFNAGTGEYSYKIIANVAIIWLGRLLKKDPVQQSTLKPENN